MSQKFKGPLNKYTQETCCGEKCRDLAEFTTGIRKMSQKPLTGPYGTFGTEPASLHYVTRQEKTMQDENFFDSIKRNLNGQPGQPIVLGVCKTLAARFNQEVWLIRLAAIVLGVFYSFITLVAYILLGLFMEETSHRTKSLFEGLGIWFREFTEKVGKLFSSTFGNGNSSHRDY
jgi:phage shock protein PspC (stress-responsive transcriptional regulator)